MLKQFTNVAFSYIIPSLVSVHVKANHSACSIWFSLRRCHVPYSGTCRATVGGKQILPVSKNNQERRWDSYT